MKSKLSLLLPILFFTLTLTASEFKTHSVAIFKDGSAFVIKKGNVATQDGIFRLEDDLPQALFGTLWVHSPTKKLSGVASYLDKVDHSNEANNIANSIRGNVGKSAKYYLHPVKKEDPVESFEGKIKAVVGTLVTIKSGSNYTTLPINRIHRVDFKEEPNLDWKSKIEKRILEVSFLNKNKSQPIEFMYLQKGIGWLPNYLIEVKGEEKAMMTLRATVVNDVENIEDAEVHFVVGVPSFLYANMTSPLVATEAVVNMLGRIGHVQPSNPTLNFGATEFSNSIGSANINYGNRQELSTLGLSSEQSLEGTSMEDLFYYTKQKVNLKKGGRGFFEVFRKEIPISHLYEVQLAPNHPQGGNYRTEFAFNPETKNPVWHSIKIKNPTDAPFHNGFCLDYQRTKRTNPSPGSEQIGFHPCRRFFLH